MYLTWKIEIKDEPIYTEFGKLVANSHERVVIGKRGPYVEIKEIASKLFIPDTEEWRVNSNNAYYVHYRVEGKAPIKVYYQKKKVVYADYKVGMFYISPFDLFNLEGKPIMKFLYNKVGQGSLF